MNSTTNIIRLRALAGTMRLLGRAVNACARSLLRVGVSPPEIAAMFEGEAAVEHVDVHAERALVLQVLDEPGPCSRADLEAALDDIEPSTVDDALRALEAVDILYIGPEQVWASRCVRRIDDLGLIGI